MRNYLIYSSSTHLLFVIGLLFFAANNPLLKKKEQTYYIDFIGASKVVAIHDGAQDKRSAAAPTAKAEARDEDDFSSGALPKPSVLSGGATLFDAQDAPQAGDEQNSTALVTDSKNFPYPWYIAQVREALWNSWTGKMPSGGNLRSTVKFTIKRNGDIKNVAVEKSSGNRLFDNASEAAAQSSAPFPPLPDDFFEDTLTVHVEFKAGD
ncbi:MAG: hypothetical protein A2234_01495 [Elusimicrobia bacterium RIFOXYA2_FULL_58_8]|nr:MAG: hypothetical protein A2285_03895 [Elusimicrobia bacterium RIFOXYA12_FULL_57_11]OGS17128.1 MAG: hypothetical protein A2234_01495 [Elusimicrobia bacterium RIFOXYA2_FULL_58_8]